MALPNDFFAAVEPPASGIGDDCHVFAFRGPRMLVRIDEHQARLPSFTDIEVLQPVRRQYLGTYAGRDVVSFEVEESLEAPEGMVFKGLRGLFMPLDEALFWIAARAIQIVAWDRDHQICGRCGTPTRDQPSEHSKKCPSCGLTHYPRLAPAVIVLVERGDEVLLGRSPHFPPGMYSTLAGFVEAGESLEQTVAREIHEESGVYVDNIRYFGSQPWPFPNSLMVGFRADYAGGDIQVDGEELEDAGFFRFDSLPKIPPRVSIARALIDAWLSERRG